MKINRYSVSVFISGCLWGFMGMFRRFMGAMGLDTFGIVLVRCTVASLCFAVLIAVRDRAMLKIRLRDIWCFIGSGIFSLLLLSVCYFQAMNLMSLSAAAILLYTSPIFVILMSAVLFKEKITPRIIAAMLLAVGGCALVSGIVGSDTRISLVGLLYGLGSGFGYALYSIFGKLAMRRGYKSNTINLYSTLFAAVAAALIWGFKEPFSIAFASPYNALVCTLNGVTTCFLPYVFFTYGLSGMEAGRVSIIASIEPVVATVVGVLIFSEAMTVFNLAGIVLVLAAIVITNTGNAEKQQS